MNFFIYIDKDLDMFILPYFPYMTRCNMTFDHKKLLYFQQKKFKIKGQIIEIIM